ncbi:MAG: excinuclease ABC subunit UvrB [Victivallaceae bacterium]|nr:excinuclease ABC subunit UvrB [Victivallaceae bacterium]
MSLFKLHSEYSPAGDQLEAIEQLSRGIESGKKSQVLRGVTGSGKTFTLANVIAKSDRPVLVLSHNKTLAAQLYSEFKGFFPDNAVEYFISYYDYYLPESYIPQTDTYIAKDASINENIEKLRLSATSSLLERRDVIVVASVSCIYGLGSPEDYSEMCVFLRRGQKFKRNDFLRKLIDIQYERNDTAPSAGQFRVRGDAVDIFEPQRDDFIRVGFWGDEIESLSRRHAVSGKVKSSPDEIRFFPCKHFVMPPDRIEDASRRILAEMRERVAWFEHKGLLVEAQRLYQRVTYDLEMMKEVGYCSGIENYSMHLADRKPGSRPYCLIDFFPPDKLTVIDESHVTLPQVQAMFKADRNRKQTLCDHGFRLPSALENRPLTFAEFEELQRQTIYVSATPGEYELGKTGGETVDQVIRPTGLLDPVIEVRPLEGQIDDAMAEIRAAAAKNERVIVTTLTKKNAERLSDYLGDTGLRCSYLHSEMDALERVRVLNKLRDGAFDCLIGINLLREGIDLPQVALVAILDADKEGFLRSARALIQVAGRAARNADGRVILYAERITDSMKELIDLTAAHREKQREYNEINHIVPKTVASIKRETIADVIGAGVKRQAVHSPEEAVAAILGANEIDLESTGALSSDDFNRLVEELEKEMTAAAKDLEFERAADLRDKIRQVKKKRR